MAEYKLTVTTGSMRHAGTYDHIFVTLFGTEGQSERTKLENIGLIKDKTGTYTIKTKTSLGKLLLLQLEKDPLLLFFPEDQWFCSKVVVTAPEEELLFPCHRWISRGQSLELRGGKAKKDFEDVHPLLIDRREKDIKMRKEMYKWEMTDDKTPQHIQFKQVSELPAEVQFSLTKQNELEYTAKIAGIALTFKGMVGSTEQWASIEAMHDIFRFHKTTITEYVAAHWKEDEFFGYQFLNGLNPFVIKKCSKLPPNFPVTDEMVTSSLGPGRSLNEEIEKGNIFIYDLKIMEKIPTRMYNGERLQMPASMSLFYMNPENKLKPIAIQLNQEPSAQNPIFLPTDSETDWLLAKIFVKSAHALEFETVNHLMGTHYIAEIFTVATLRNFHPIHPLYKLLIPHFQYTLHINTLSRTILFGPEGALSSSTLGYDGLTELVRRGFAETTYSSLCLPENIIARGLDSIPDYYFRDDGLKLWNIIHSYMKKMLEFYYPSDADVSKDAELQAWIQEVFTNGFLGNKSSGIPSEFTNVTDLVKFLTMVIYTTTAHHASLNNGQFDYLAWVLNGPFLLRKPPPTTKGLSSMDTILETAPDIGESVKFVTLTLILTEKYTDMILLGEFPEARFDEPEPKQIIQEFQAELSRLSEAIQARNAELEIPYTYMNPNQIENSITI